MLVERVTVAEQLIATRHGSADIMANGPPKAEANGFAVAGGGMKIAQNGWRCDRCATKD